MNHVVLRMLVVVGIGCAGTVWCRAQSLPLEAVSVRNRTDERPRVAFPEARDRVLAGIAALRKGDLREVKQQLSGSDGVVDLDQGQSSGHLSQSECALGGGLLCFVAGDLRGAYEGGRTVLCSDDVTDADKADAHVLLAFAFYRLNVLALANRHAAAARRLAPDLPVHRPLKAAIEESLGGAFEPTGPSKDPDGNGNGWVRWWGFYSRRDAGSTPSDQQPHTVAWFWDEQAERFAGALTMDRVGDSRAEKTHYQLVFRDFDGPSITLRDGPVELPLRGYSTQLIEFARAFSATCERPDKDRRVSLLRAQMEALWFHEAGLTPLAARWRMSIGAADPLLDEQVREPLQSAHAWRWEPWGRWRAGPIQSSPYEIVGYVNRETTSPKALRDLTGLLEHFYFVAATPEQHSYAGSYRVVSDSLNSGERLFRMERLLGQEITVLDVLTELPSREAARDRVLGWLNGVSSQDEVTLITNSIGMKLALVPAGEFMMGSRKGEANESPNYEYPHRVCITKPFYLGTYEVTQEEYDQVMETNPSRFAPTGRYEDRVPGMDTRRFPVEGVSAIDAMEFCRRLSSLADEESAGRVYRLPTEAEWEYACRAGTTTPFHFGSRLSGREANCNGREPFRTESGPALDRPTTVGCYPANAFGLRDMHGNVNEWCSDWFERDYYLDSTSDDPRGPTSASFRVIRGGSWLSNGDQCRSAFRNSRVPSEQDSTIGFRVAMTRPEL